MVLIIAPQYILLLTYYLVQIYELQRNICGSSLILKLWGQIREI